MNVTTKLTADLTRPNVGTRVHAVQGDGSTRLLETTLLSGGEAWVPPEGTETAVAYYQPNGHKGLYDKLADGTPAVSISGNVATITLAAQMLTASGTVQAALVFNDAQMNRLTTFPFFVSVARSPAVGAQKTEDYIRLQWLEDKLDEYLKLAKESGEFDGPQGPQGEVGPQGPQGEVGPQGPAGDNTEALAAAQAANAAAQNADAAAGRADVAAGNANAAAKAVIGDVKQIKDDLVKKISDTALWEIGSYNVESGSKQANANYLRTADFLNEKVKSITSPLEWRGLYCFAWENETYIGVWRKSDNSFTTLGSTPQKSINIDELRKIFPNYSFKVSATSGNVMDISDSEDILIESLNIAYEDDIERSLAESKQYTDGKLKPVSEKVHNIENFFVHDISDTSLWEKGLYDTSDGTKISSNAWLRTIDYLSAVVTKVCSEDYSMVLLAWENDNFVGAWRKSDNSFVTTGTTYNSEFDIAAILKSYPSYKFKVAFKTNLSAIDISASENVILTINDAVKYTEAENMVNDALNKAKDYADSKDSVHEMSAIPAKGQVCYSADSKVEYHGYYIRNAVAYNDGVIIACRADGRVVRIGYEGEETLHQVTGTKMDWRCCWMDSNENVYVSPHGSWGNVSQAERGLYRLEKGASSLTKVISLYNPSSSVPSESQPNDDTIWTMCEDDKGNIYAGVYAHTVRKNPKIYKSTDGGNTFSVICDMNTYIDTGKHIHSIIWNKWKKALYCIVGEYNTIYKSIDGGITWDDLQIKLDAKGSALCATKDGIFIGSDGTMLRIDWLHNDDKTHETVFRGWANTIFAIRQSDITGFLYAFTKIDSSVNTLFPPRTVLTGETTLDQWKSSVASSYVNAWQECYDEVIDTFPEDAIRPQHYGIIVSRDGGSKWEVLHYVKSDSIGADGFWTIGWFRNGEILASAQVQKNVDGTNSPYILPPTIISEGKHKYVNGGCDFDGEIFIRTNSNTIAPLLT